MSGLVSYLAGLAGEDSVIRHYRRDGWLPVAQRWRGEAGEIDLIFQRQERFAIVEVKKSRSFAAAMARVSPAQARRIEATMLEFLVSTPKGLNTDVTCDVAAVDAHGQVLVLFGALSYESTQL
ncbi:YraN family protein [Shimia ponticola]|uniref:YraN family protein n=1 Tax=Shimia ponticola TaxID=2582893 RepID=UPI0011BE92FC|nr:YraN family protein [Shimia ponticola]